ncbi:MAG: hypothetical protein J6J12_03910 [Oscillospiraceae bacterium]|nr:hypothetical protein [Oscillospiraceae bacterium]
MTGNELYQLSLTHPAVKALIPEGFFPTLPGIQMRKDCTAIQFFYTCRYHFSSDYFCITLSGTEPYSVLRFQMLEPAASLPKEHSGPIGILPPAWLDYYQQCAACLSIQETSALWDAILQLKRRRIRERSTLSRYWLTNRLNRSCGCQEIAAHGKTSVRQEPFRQPANANCVIQLYSHKPGELRQMVTATTDEVFLLHTTENGSGFQIRHLAAGQSWQEGPRELVAVYDTEKAALKAMDAKFRERRN